MHESFESLYERLRHEHVHNSFVSPSNPSWHEQMQADLIVAGLSERTQEAYLRAVRQLSDYYNGTLPADLSEQHLKDYLLWMRSEKRAAPGTLRIAIGGLRFYDAMFKAAAFALRTTMAEPKFCGATQIGFTSVLHTFGGDLVYHPHIHVLMPSGGLNEAGEWKSLPPGFVLPVKLLSIRFRMEFERLVRSTSPPEDEATNGSVSADRHSTAFDLPRPRPLGLPAFNSFAKLVGDGVATLNYLSRYMFRTAITNKRIVAVDEAHVSFTYRRKSKHSDGEPSSKDRFAR